MCSWEPGNSTGPRSIFSIWMISSCRIPASHAAARTGEEEVDEGEVNGIDAHICAAGGAEAWSGEDTSIRGGRLYLSIWPSLPRPLQLAHTICAWSFLAAFARSVEPDLRTNPAPSHSGHLRRRPSNASARYPY